MHFKQLLLGLLISILLASCNLPDPIQTQDIPDSTLTISFNAEISPSPTIESSATSITINGKIVFTCQVTKESISNQLCLINPDGTGWRQLTDDLNSDHFFASFSPDGESIVYSSNKSGSYNIWEIELNGMQTQLTDSGFAFAPAVSPDNSKIVYTYNPGGQLSDAQLWMMDRNGGNRYPLTGLDGGAWDVTWSPDGDRILFASQIGENVQLFTLSVSGDDIQLVTILEGLRGRNDWSIDGLLSTYIGTSWNREIVTFDVDGKNVTYITNGGNNLAPSFSPDGEWIVFTSYIDNYLDDHGCEIYIMKKDGTEQRRLTENDYCDWQPRWGN